MTRALSALFLSLVLALTSHSAAVAKAAPAAVDQMVICTGLGITVVYTDADGQPTTVPHLCPDCVVHQAAGILPQGPAPVRALDGAIRQEVAANDPVVCSKPRVALHVRGPPLDI